MTLQPSNIEEIFKLFEHQKVLVIGDVMIDTYLWGNVDRISPESPVPVVDVKKIESRLGGAANVALNVNAMGAEAILCSICGNDADANILLQLLDKHRLGIEGLLKLDNRKTTNKTRILCRNQQMLRFDREDSNNISQEEAIRFIDRILTMLDRHKITAVILQDYNKGLLTPYLIESIIKICNERNIPVAVDPKKRNFTLYKGVTLFKPNLREITEGLNIEIEDTTIESLDHASQLLMQELNNAITFITLSDRGIYINNGKKSKIIPTEVRNVADVSGAGDTVISVAALGMAAGLDMTDTAKLANIAGGLVCEEVGVVPVNKEKLKEEALKTF